MRNFTNEEIRLCKEIAKKERKDIGLGDWIKREGKAVELVCCVFTDDDTLIGTDLEVIKKSSCIPLWQEHDCLEWLKEKYDDVNIGSIEDEWEAQVHDAYDKVHHPEYLENIRGKTPLEALLRAVLAVMEDR